MNSHTADNSKSPACLLLDKTSSLTMCLTGIITPSSRGSVRLTGVLATCVEQHMATVRDCYYRCSCPSQAHWRLPSRQQTLRTLLLLSGTDPPTATQVIQVCCLGVVPLWAWLRPQLPPGAITDSGIQSQVMPEGRLCGYWISVHF